MQRKNFKISSSSYVYQDRRHIKGCKILKLSKSKPLLRLTCSSHGLLAKGAGGWQRGRIRRNGWQVPGNFQFSDKEWGCDPLSSLATGVGHREATLDCFSVNRGGREPGRMRDRYGR
uniref:Uncharacterized protein n=1 Tax=Romanomermis culicivorax TaxID=13658 RepID=A0A915KNM9_ROMCU